MIDQAQGLRALVNRARRDHAGSSLLDDNASEHASHNHSDSDTTDFDTLNIATIDREAVLGGAAPAQDVLNPDALPASSEVRADTLGGSPAPVMNTAVVPGAARVSPAISPAVISGASAVPDHSRERAQSTAVYAAVPHRRSQEREIAPAPIAPIAQARVVAVTSGKGGVGKTNLCSNLALTLAARGQRVIIVDADLGLANVHVVLGVAPRFHLEHVMRGEKTLQEALYMGPGGVGIIGGGSGLTDMANLDETRRARFIANLSELDSLADVVLLDTGAGLSHNVLAFLCAVDEVIVITTPEPTAITDAYATIKVLSQENPGARQRLVVNMAQSEAEAQAVAQRLQSITRRFLGRDLDWLGYLPHDMTVSRAVRAQQPFSTLAPDAPASRAIVRLAARLGYEQPPANTSAAGVSGLLTRMQRFFQHRSSAM